MSREFIQSLRIQEFGCIRDATIELTPLHALIGPNDSGKSTALRALQAMADIVANGQSSPFWNRRTRSGMSIVAQVNARYFFLEHPHWTLRFAGNTYGSTQGTAEFDVLRGATLLRLDPDEICAPAKPLPESQAFALTERGRGMPAAYEALLSRDRDAFSNIERRVRELFPTVKSIWLPTTPDHQKKLGVELTNGTRISGSEMSEGLVYWLAFAILEHIQPSPILLIEEPETGLHPSRIVEVMRVLREVSKTTQVLLATHSPLVVNEMRPDEVTLLTRDPDLGTIATPIVKTKAFAARTEVYALGELWLSFADGLTESALVPDKTGT